MDELLALIVLGFPTAVILTPLVLRSWERRRILDAVMTASNAGQAVPAPVIEALIAGNRDKRAAMPRPEKDYRRGLLLIGTCFGFFAVALVLYAMLRIGNVEEAPMAALAVGGVGLFPGLIGATYVLLSRMARKD